MDVDFPMAVSDRPAWLAPFQHPKWSTFHVAFLKKTIEELLRLWLEAPMIRMERHVLAAHPTLEERRGRQLANHFPYCLPLGRVTLRELEVQRPVFAVVEADHEDTLPDLGYTEILRVQFAFENGKAGRSKELLEIAEKF